MVLEKLEQELSKKILRSIYVFSGEETYLLEQTVNRIKKHFGTLQEGINYCYLDETNVDNVITEIETPSFGFEKKLIIIKKASLLEGKKRSSKKSSDAGNEEASKSAKTQNTISTKLAEYIEKNIDIISESVVLIIIEEKAEKCKLLEVLKSIEESSKEQNFVAVCEFQKLKPNQLVMRLKNICGKYNVRVSEQVLMYLIEISGTSMQNLMNEVRKLIEYAGPDGEITREAVDLLAIPEIDNIIFNLTDALGVKDVKKALETLNDLIYLKEPLQAIMINLYRHFKKLYFVKLAENESGGMNLTEVLDLKPNQMFLTTKYRKQATYFKEEELRDFLSNMLQLEEKYKTGNIDLQIGIEVLIAGVKKGE